MSDAAMQMLPVLSDFEIAPIEIAPNTPSEAKFVLLEASGELCLSASEAAGDGEISNCVVCDKRFKSKACLNKHMRSVHTVKVLTSAKRAATLAAGHAKATASKRSQAGESQSSITHTGLPVNPITAKALASKLNERNSFLNGQSSRVNGSAAKAAKQSDIPMPPLVSIQTPPSQHQPNERKRPANTDAESSDDDHEPNAVNLFARNLLSTTKMKLVSLFSRTAKKSTAASCAERDSAR